MNKFKSIFQLLRPYQYVKNLFVFAPFFFSFKFTLYKFIEESIIFALFSLLASSVYIINDLLDINEDRKHPVKKYRPLASGQVNKSLAIFLASILGTFSLGSAFIFNMHLFLILIVYLFLNILYSIKLKHIAVVDIFIIAVGFTIRLFAGNSVLDSQLSMWIIIMTFLLALFLAIAKRRDDVLLLRQGKEVRRNINGYNLEFINSVMVLMAGVIVVSYILYTVSNDVILRLHTEYLYLTSFFVILGVIRYMQITFVEEISGSPTKIVLKDTFLQVTILLWLVSFFVIARGDVWIKILK